MKKSWMGNICRYVRHVVRNAVFIGLVISLYGFNCKSRNLRVLASDRLTVVQFLTVTANLVTSDLRISVPITSFCLYKFRLLELVLPLSWGLVTRARHFTARTEMECFIARG